MDRYSLMTDADLSERLGQLDHAAFKEIYKRYWRLLYNYARRMVGNDDQAKDIVQEIFTSIWTKAAQLSIKSYLSSFLFSAVKYKVIDYIKSKKVKESYYADALAELSTTNADTDHRVRERQMEEIIQLEIAKLPQKMREVFELSRQAHLNYKEIADQLDISEGTARVQIHNAVKILRLKIGSFFFLMVMQVMIALSRLF